MISVFGCGRGSVSVTTEFERGRRGATGSLTKLASIALMLATGANGTTCSASKTGSGLVAGCSAGGGVGGPTGGTTASVASGVGSGVGLAVGLAVGIGVAVGVAEEVGAGDGNA
jgi:hypothetical protein